MKILFALGGWLLWNFAVFSLDKNKDDESHLKFPIWQYVGEKWDNWAGSLICCVVLMFIMKLGYGVDVLNTINLGTLKWSDSLIGASGPAYEVVLWMIGKVRSSLPKS